MSQAGRTIELVAARHRLGVARGTEFVKAAEAAILAGFESYELNLLAAESDPILSEAVPLFEKGLAGLSIEIPDTEAACRIIIRHHLERVESRQVTPGDGVGQILIVIEGTDLFHERSDEYVGDALDLHEIVGNYYSMDDIREASFDGQGDPKELAVVEGHLFELAKKWLRADRSRSGHPDGAGPPSSAG